MTTVQGTTVDITTGDGVADAYLVHPEGGRPRPGILMYMDAFGLRPSLRRMAARLAAAGYTVLVPNVFYRIKPAPVMELPDFIDPSQRMEIFEELGPMMRRLTPEAAMRDADAYLRFLAERPESSEGRVGVTGYCMGAALALRTAGAFPEHVAAVAGFHGAGLATEASDSPHLRAGDITAELYWGHADQDPAMPPEQIDRLDRALTAANVPYETEVYAGAPHGFTQADTAAYDAEATERHWRALLDLMGRKL